MRTPGQRFWKWPCVAHLFGVGWTCGVISRRLETVHYTDLSGTLTLAELFPIYTSDIFVFNPIDHYQFPIQTVSVLNHLSIAPALTQGSTQKTHTVNDRYKHKFNICDSGFLQITK